MDTATALNDSGIALTEANRPNDAIVFFRKALAIEPGNPLLWLNLGIAQQRTGSYDEAIDSFRRALGIDGELCEAWLSMGLIYYETEELELSEDCYHSALASDDSNPKVWNNLGVLHFSKGNYDEARGCFEEAVSIAPHFRDALFNLRDACKRLGDRRAAAEFDRALSELPGRRGLAAHPGVGG